MANNDEKPERIYSVSEYIEAVNIALKKFRVKVAGEVTEVDDRGHIWFSIKDKDDGAILNSVIWQSNYKMCGVKIEEGIEVILTGYADIYPRSGQFKFKAETIELKGEGALKKAYEALRKKLDGEGIFAAERKRPLAEFPQKIGVITSRQGAVINDLLSNLGKFGFRIKMIDSRVEGQEAVKDLLSAVDVFRRQDIDVLVIMRGGGSLESLQAFNNEMLVRAIVDFPAPIIAAIGHEKDVCLLALAADVACSTPTAAANLISKSWEMAPLKINQYERFIFEKFAKSIFRTSSALWTLFSNLSDNLNVFFNQYRNWELGLKNYLNIVNQALKGNGEDVNFYGLRIVSQFSRQFKDIIFDFNLKGGFAKIQQSLKNSNDYLDASGVKITNWFSSRIGNIIRQMCLISRTIQANNPEKNLSLGYCLARKNGRIIRTVQDVKIGENVELQVKDGVMGSTINTIRPVK